MRPQLTITQSRRIRIIHGALAFVILTGAALAGANASWIGHTTTKKASEGIPPTAIAVQSVAIPAIPAQATLEAERITLRPTGFEPNEITRPAGRFLLAVNDRSGQDNVVLVLLQPAGPQVLTTRMRDNPRKHEWRQVVTLPPGTYLLSEISNPQHGCRITLTAN